MRRASPVFAVSQLPGALWLKIFFLSKAKLVAGRLFDTRFQDSKRCVPLKPGDMDWADRLPYNCRAGVLQLFYPDQ